VKKNDKPELDSNGSTVLLKSIQCTGSSTAEQEEQLSSLDVAFQFTAAEGRSSFHITDVLTLKMSIAAKSFCQRVEGMRMELFVMSLQYPRQDEGIVLKL
jgi:hypothetical protein